jgi:hypothetical protein
MRQTSQSSVTDLLIATLERIPGCLFLLAISPAAFISETVAEYQSSAPAGILYLVIAFVATRLSAHLAMKADHALALSIPWQERYFRGSGGDFLKISSPLSF